jgi:hypothetical protein
LEPSLAFVGLAFSSFRHFRPVLRWALDCIALVIHLLSKHIKCSSLSDNKGLLLVANGTTRLLRILNLVRKLHGHDISASWSGGTVRSRVLDINVA